MKFTDSSAWKQAITLEPTFLTPAKNKMNNAPTYICPVCNQGATKGNGIAWNPKTGDHRKWKCFGGCDLNGDILELWQYHTGTEDQNKEKCFKELCQVLGLSYDANRKRDYNNAQSFNNERTETIKQSQQQSIEKTEKRITEQSQGSFINYSDYFEQCHAALDKTNEFTGIRQHVREEFRLGYDSRRNSLIIPIDDFRYVERFLNPNSKIKSLYHPKGMKRIAFNLKCLENDGPVFLVEGERDALAIISCGFDAVATGGNGGIKPIINKLKEQKEDGKEPIIIIATDNDKDGQKHADKWERDLKEIGIRYSRPTDFYGDMKDARDCLEDNEQDLILNLEEAFQEAKDPLFLKSELSYLDQFFKGIETPSPSVPTGFNQLDQALGGGLNGGLLVMGAISSLGKTTLAIQIACQIAQQKKDVLIYSLEMSRQELTAKNLSRETLLLARDAGDGIPIEQALSAMEISKYGLNNFSNTKQNLLTNSFVKYKEYAEYLFIEEGGQSFHAKAISNTIEEHITYRDQKPIIIIDYLQMISWHDDKQDKKNSIDRVVEDLRAIAKKFETTVIVISSFNRESYKFPVSMSSFKESGGIEYTADVLIGLQFEGTGQQGFDVDDARSKTPRDIELVILKNRNGTSGNKVGFKYYQKFNYFSEKVSY